MCKAFEELAEKWAMEEKKEIAVRFLKKGLISIEEIAECTGVPLEEVKELQKSLVNA